MKRLDQHEENEHTGVVHCSPLQDERSSPAVSPDSTLLACTAQSPIPASPERKTCHQSLATEGLSHT